TGDGHLIDFARPGDAVRAAIAICRAAPTLGVTLRAGVHAGEIERRENGDIGGLTVHIAALIAPFAGAGEVVVSRTVADLLGATVPRIRGSGSSGSSRMLGVRSRMRSSAAWDSTRVRCIPRQMWGPVPNAMWAVAAREILNASGSG